MTPFPTQSPVCNSNNTSVYSDALNSTCNSSLTLNYSNETGSNATKMNSSCSDINECAVNALSVSLCNFTQTARSDNCTRPLCESFQACINTLGSFYCQCLPGFVVNNGECIDDPGNNATLQENTAFGRQTPAFYSNISAKDFGHAIAIYNNYLLIGSSDSSDAYLYKKTSPGGWPAEPTYILSRSDARDGVYGISVAVFSAAFGGSVHAVVGTNRNKVYIHQIDRFGRWTVGSPRILVRPNDLFFGTSVAASSTSVLVGAYGANKAFLYERQFDQSWPLVPTTQFDQNIGETFFGHVVAMTEDCIAIGALHVGKVFIFVRATGGAWSNIARHVLQAASSEVILGTSLSMTTLHLFVGVSGRKTVYIFTKNSTGDWPASPTSTLSRSDGAFGHCVGNTDLYAVVGSFRANRAFLYQIQRNGSWGSAPLQQFSLPPSLSLLPSTSSRSLGFACGMTNHDVVLSSYQVRVPPF